MNTQHTPGPWHVGVRQAEKIVYDSTGWAVANATVYHGENDIEQVNANARLIAAAPDLLDALQRIAAGEVMTGNFNHAETVHEYQKLARAAIAKATRGAE
jgi:hypothetical protein